MIINSTRIVSFVIIVALIAGGVYFLNKENKSLVQNLPTPTPTVPPDSPQRVTFEGQYVCLPHKGDGPHTLECAFGMKTDDGNHYALDIGPSRENQYPNLPTGSRIKVTGMLTLIERLSTDFWQRYDIKGIISVETFQAQ